jgi:hypothetical protein
MTMKIPKSPYSADDLRNYDTSRTPTLLTQGFHDHAVAFQKREREAALLEAAYQKELQYVSLIPYGERLNALANGLVTGGEASLIVGSFNYRLGQVAGFVPWWKGAWGVDRDTGTVVFLFNEILCALCELPSPYGIVQIIIKSLKLYFDFYQAAPRPANIKTAMRISAAAVGGVEPPRKHFDLVGIMEEALSRQPAPPPTPVNQENPPADAMPVSDIQVTTTPAQGADENSAVALPAATVAAYREVLKAYGARPGRRRNDALPKRMDVYLRKTSGEPYSDIEARYPDENIARMLQDAIKKDIPKLKELYPESVGKL